MANGERRIVLDRANRMLKQSRTLRRLSDELLKESNDLRAAAKDRKRKKARTQRVTPRRGEDGSPACPQVARSA
jgi:hypothetical protein